MISSTSSLYLLSGIFQAVAGRSALLVPRDGASPTLPYDDNTTKHCSWWLDYSGATSCPTVLSDNFIGLEDFRRWNPSITDDGGNLIAGRSYCVEAREEPAPVPTSSSSFLSPSSSPSSVSSTLIKSTTSQPIVITISSTPTSTLPSTTSSSTSAGNGVSTPLPTQPGMVNDCNKFHWVSKGNTCSQIYTYQRISLADFVKWNPTVKSDCSGMWAEVQVCVGVIGGTSTTTTTPKPSSTTPGNGVQTPQPTQPGMVTNCNKFHWVAKGVTCNQIYSFQKISLADFVKWNPTVKSDCSGMWAEVQVCVGVIGGGSNPTPTTSAGNGVQTPQPTQPGMVTNCKRFHYVAAGVVCSQIISYQKITLADFIRWNTGIKSDCSNMWSGTNVCVGV